MRRTILALTSFLIVIVVSAGIAVAQRDKFINVEGSDLRAKIDAAVKRARASSQSSPFWVAYSFDVRPGVAVDAQLNEFRGTTNDFSGVTISMGTSSGRMVETRNLGVFMLYEASGNSVTRVEIYNLDRPREYSGYPVYWLGRAGNEESLSLLKGLIETNQTGRVAEHSILAIGLHDDRRVAALLKDLFRNHKAERVRSSAIFWLGQIGGELQFLTDVARDEQESVEVRKNAVFAIGVSKDAGALATLKSLYASVSNREVKRHIIFAASINESKDEAVDFLIKIVSSDADAETRKQALFWLGQKAGERSLEVLGDVAKSDDTQTEVQEAAVFAISRRPKDEAIPMLINIAKTHRKADVRRQAIFWLSQSGDQRAIDFFKELLK
jgi:HEAT repeat protein